MVQGHSRWRVRVYPEVLSHKLLKTMEVRVDQEDVHEELITLEGINGKYMKKVRKEPDGQIKTAVECSETYEASFKADPRGGHCARAVPPDGPAKKSDIKSAFAQQSIEVDSCCESLEHIPKVKSYKIENEKVLFVEEAQAKSYDQVYCWNEDGVLTCLSDDPNVPVKPKIQTESAKIKHRRDPMSGKLSSLRLDFEEDCEDGGLLAGENIAPGTVIWEFYPKLLPEFDKSIEEDAIPEVIIEYPEDLVSKAHDRDENQENGNGDKISREDSEKNTGLEGGASVHLDADRNNNSETSDNLNGRQSRLDSEQSSHSEHSDDEYCKTGKHFTWELSLGVRKPYLKSMLKEPLSNGVLLQTLTSSYQSKCLPDTYIILNNDLRFLRYANEGNVSLQQSEIVNEEGSMVIDQIVATKDINVGDEVLRDFKTIIEELQSGFLPFSPFTP